jgi:hypothetical protein
MVSSLRSAVLAATLAAMACAPDPDDELTALLKAEKFEETDEESGLLPMRDERVFYEP